MESMIKLEGLESMGVVGADKQVKNYHQLKNIIIDHYDELKRIAARKKNNDIMPRLMELIELEKDTPDWTRDEKIDNWLDLAGTVDMSLVLTEEHWKLINRFNLISIDEVPELSEEDGIDEIKNQFVWFIVRSVAAKTSSTGKPFLEIKANGDRFVDINIKLWNCQKAKEIVDKKLIRKNTVMSGVVSRHVKFGFSSYYNKIAPLLEAASFGESDTPIG
jgi:hypothetical protein